MKLHALILTFIFSTFSFGEEGFYSLSAKSIKGEKVNFSSFKGKTVLFVNIASRCGYTPQLEGLQQLYEKFRSKNFTIVGVPSNEFGGQSPESDTEMVKFCKLNYGVSFPLLSKISVRGSEKHPVFKFLIDKSGSKKEISWNFEKFLINGKGELVSRFRSGDSPLGNKIINQITKIIN